MVSEERPRAGKKQVHETKHLDRTRFFVVTEDKKKERAMILDCERSEQTLLVVYFECSGV
jgi:hypothetical protein